MESLEQMTAEWPGAVVVIDAGSDDPMFRPAAFVFDLPGGMAWVEPAYADPAGAASPAYHVWMGQRQEDGVTFVADSGRVLRLLRYEEDNVAEVGDALEWFAAYLKAAQRTHGQERQRVRAALEAELAAAR